MYSKKDLLKQIADLGIKRSDTIHIHSSMKAIGEVKNRADTVLDAFIEYSEPGLLIFPTHTWTYENNKDNIFNPLTEPSCVGILTNLFMRRPGVLRSWHPTHSVAALGREALCFVSGEEQWDTPCPRKGCYGKLYDRKAKILFIGCSLNTNTLIHGVEEWNNIPDRLSKNHRQYKILTPDKKLLPCPMRHHLSPYGDVSNNYGKLQAPLLYKGIAQKGFIGDAVSVVCDVEAMVELTTSFLRRNRDLFADNSPIPNEWYIG